ncbi:iron (metal) dependent repressor, DtxR family [Clostridium cavendishii DSM 21758]|uniref:Iron (Metal) dependent repressor, DtxR family n=1 Tax=Clostridium cavendishii DSM 21758 TaxID=1121302 RepID=A0A1M6DH12_9CLOT|nr:metal-dependent transcriptional regulator [Clostridium cavendishii]SHI72329.1 iron (metal) dependent repressor, DtxR family [Clostridium cavendishii DSM 21758]
MYESGENYLETILILKKEIGSVRAIDIAKKLNFSKPSVSRALGILREEKYIDIDSNGYILFTDIGAEKAEAIYERHKILTKFLVKTASISEKVAEEDACKIEHIISDETFKGIKKFIEK